MAQTKILSNLDFLTAIYKNFPGNKVLFLFMVLLKLGINSLGLVTVFLMGKFIDFFSTNNYQNNNDYLMIIILILIVSLVKLIATVHTNYYLKKSGVILKKRFRSLGLQKILDLNLLWHVDLNSGTKMSKVSNGAAAVSRFSRMFANDISGILVNLVSVILIFIFLDLKYFMIFLGVTILYLIIEYYFKPKKEKAQVELKEINSKSNGKINETISNVLTVKAMGLKKNMKDRVISQEDKIVSKWDENRKIGQTRALFIHSLIIVSTSVFLYFIANDIITGIVTVGGIVMYNAYFGKFTSAIMRISVVYDSFIDQKTSFSELYEILSEHKDNHDLNGEERLQNVNNILFENVYFKYKDQFVLKDFSLELKRGEKIGVVGVSGSGKSTLIKALLRLHKLESGNIKINNINLNDIEDDSLRDKITLIPQEHELFNMTAKDNITFGKNGIKYEEVKKLAVLNDVLDNMPDKDNTVIGEKGYRLSGGERQRLGIARALYKDSDVLVFDEATSNLDLNTEYEIQKNLETLKDKTMIIVAHRLSTLKDVDRILYMEKGKIIEQGSYQELKNLKGRFYELEKKQEREDR